MKIRTFLRNRKFLRTVKKHTGERGVWNGCYNGRNIRFVATTYQASQIIRGFIKSVNEDAL